MDLLAILVGFALSLILGYHWGWEDGVRDASDGAKRGYFWSRRTRGGVR